MAQHLLVVGPRGLVAGREHHQEVVEVVATAGGATLHQREVVGREDRDPQQVEPIAGPGQGVPVDEDPVAARDPQLGVEALAAPGVVDRGPHDGVVTAVAHQRDVAHPAERPSERHPGHRLQQRRLAGAVGPLEHGDPRSDGQLDVLVPTEVPELQASQVHRGAGRAGA